jgi:hypothetical protein
MGNMDLPSGGERSELEANLTFIYYGSEESVDL